MIKSRAAVAFEAKKPLEIVEVDVAMPKAGEVLLRVVASGVCHTDAYTLSGADPEGIFPSILGHEGGAIVEAIGEGVVETLKKYPKSPAVLMQNHGPFTIGKDAEAAVKAAAMTEEVAHTMWAAKQLGDIIPISQEDIDSLNDRYTNVYGQH